MAGRAEPREVGARRVAITRPQKVLFPEAGITKADRVAYYRRIARWMLPHLRGRPIAMERYPDGIVVLFLQFRALPASGWLILDAIVTLLVALVIWHPWPSSARWAIGILVGINLVASGVTLLMYAVTARKALNALA